jgi:hypothetical protein
MNSFFGYSYTNMRLGNIPFNEIFLMAGLFLAMSLLPIVIKYNPVIKPILLWSILFMPVVFYGVTIYGFFALRDASHSIEIWWIPLAIIAFFDINEQKLHKILKICIILYIVRAGIQLFFSNTFTISGLHGEIPLFATHNMIIIGGICFWGIIVGLHKNYVILGLYLLSIILSQSRTEILVICFCGLVYLFIKRMSRSIIMRFLFFLFAAVICYSVLVNIESINNLASKSKFGRILSVSEYAELMSSSIGKSDKFEGSADGVPLRLGWAETIFTKAENDFSILLFGQGFGMPLTDFVISNSVIVREPHNSFLSVFARTGLIGIVVWSIFHVSISIKLFFFFRRNSILTQNDYAAKFLLCCFLTFTGSYVWALTQPYFETPYSAITIFITVGLMIRLYQQIESRQLKIDKQV